MIKHMQSDINYVAQWARNNILKLNSNKTHATVFTSSIYPSIETLSAFPPLLVNGTHILYKESVKDLGLLLDRGLSWKEQVNSISRKTFMVLQLLNRNKDSLPTPTRLLLVKLLVLPFFDYCCHVYDYITNELNNKLERALNNCIRFVYNLPRTEHITGYKIRSGLLNVAPRRQLFIGNLVYSIINSKTPLYLYHFFNFKNSEQLNYARLRERKDILIIPFHRTCKMQKSFIVRRSDFKTKLAELEDTIQNVDGDILIVGDFNAKAIAWGERHTNSRGRRIIQMMSRLDLIIGNISTF